MRPESPTTEAELEAAGYEYEDTRACRWCGAEIAWFRAPHRPGQAERRVPFEEGTLERHLCPRRP
jgi:hypothetical protein